MVYQWKDASMIKADANVAGSLMQSLEKEGQLTPEKLVEVSKPVDAPLHNDFEWDDDKAAHQWRKYQARHIINCLTIVQDDAIRITEPVRAFYRLENVEKQYTHLTTIMKEPDLKEALLKRALDDLKVFKQKYETLDELFFVMEGIEKTFSLYNEKEA